MATDVAGRGIDIKDVSLIINYDMAKSIERKNCFYIYMLLVTKDFDHRYNCPAEYAREM